MKLQEILAILGVFVIFAGAVFVADYVSDNANPPIQEIEEELISKELTFYNMYAEIGLENSGDEMKNKSMRFNLGSISNENVSQFLIIDRSGTVLEVTPEEDKNIVWVKIPTIYANTTTRLFILPIEDDSIMPEFGETIDYAYTP